MITPHVSITRAVSPPTSAPFPSSTSALASPELELVAWFHPWSTSLSWQLMPTFKWPDSIASSLPKSWPSLAWVTFKKSVILSLKNESFLSVLFLYLEKNAFYRHHSLDHTNNQTSVFNFKDDLQSYYTVWRKSGVFILITFLNFCVTLIVFPAVTVLIEPENKTNSDWHQIFFVPVLCFVVFNAGDVAGKSLAAWLQWPQTSPRDQV